MKDKKNSEENSEANPSIDDSAAKACSLENPVPELSASERATFEAINRSDQFTVREAVKYFKGIKYAK